jgi:hypothetical protein
LIITGRLNFIESTVDKRVITPWRKERRQKRILSERHLCEHGGRVLGG